MKPQGNRVGIWTDRNARSQRIIGIEEDTKSSPPDAALPNTPDFLTDHNFLIKNFPEITRESEAEHLEKRPDRGAEAAKHKSKGIRK
jgi:hypothetical protein